jgi:predicted esterase
MVWPSRARGIVVSGVLVLSLGCGQVPSPDTKPGALTVAKTATGGNGQRSPAPAVPSRLPVASDVEQPAPPLVLTAPPEPPRRLKDSDLTTIGVDRLTAIAHQFYAEKNYPQAIVFLHHATTRGGSGEYDLACYYALDGKLDAAFYWLQKAAATEGVDADWAEHDSDLASLRRDARWPRIAGYLAACNAYWAGSGRHSTVLVIPDGYQPRAPIGVLVGMHGMGANPEGFISKDFFQGVANELKVAVVGVSGTIPRGERKFVWSEDPARDGEQVRRALDELKHRLTPAAGGLVAFGFSQGAQMAFEVAFAHPAEYAGAIVLSPGTTKSVTFRELTPGPENRKQSFVCTCGAQELFGNVFLTRTDSEFATKAGSRVILKLYEGASSHGFPDDFSEAFPRWVRFVRGEKAPK